MSADWRAIGPFEKSILATLGWFAFLQIGVQLILGRNPYTVWDWFEVWTHIIGSVVLGQVTIKFLSLPARFDKWRYWIPLLSLISVFTLGIGYEILELLITWFSWMPADQMYATITNSFLVDMPHDFSGACIAALIWNELVEKPRLLAQMNKRGRRS